MPKAYRVGIWQDSEDENPEEEFVVEGETPFIWQPDPDFESPPLGIDIHPDDREATLKIYTSEKARRPPRYDNDIDLDFWNGPVGEGVTFSEGDTPFWSQFSGRIMFFIE